VTVNEIQPEMQHQQQVREILASLAVMLRANDWSCGNVTRCVTTSSPAWAASAETRLVLLKGRCCSLEQCNDLQFYFVSVVNAGT
jgi:hypothetical protein